VLSGEICRKSLFLQEFTRTFENSQFPTSGIDWAL
jgi:hypothetical protein